MTKSICKICSSTAILKYCVQQNLVYDCCDSCFYCEKRPEHTSVDADYVASQAMYYENPDLDPFLEPSSVLDEKMKYRINLAAAYLKENDRVIEIGPGRGSFLAWLRSEGYSCTACEQSVVLTKELRDKGFEVIEGEFERLNFKSQYNLVFSFHIIEHVTSPLAHLEQAFKVTRPGGHLVLATPNSVSWQQRLLPLLSANFDTAHLHVFSKRSLKLLGEKSGWIHVHDSTFENVSGWLRLFSKLFRRIKGENESMTAGKYANLGATSGSMNKLILLFSFISGPFRRIQAAVGGGSEVFIVLRKPGNGMGE